MTNEETRIMDALRSGWTQRGDLVKELCGSDQPDIIALIEKQNALVSELMEAIKCQN
jgi:hypothetical protein